MNQFLSNSKEVIDLTQIPLTTADEVESLNEEIEGLKKTLSERAPAEQRDTLARFVARIEVGQKELQISVEISNLRTIVLGTSMHGNNKSSPHSQAVHLLHMPFGSRRRFAESKAIIGNGIEDIANSNSGLITVIARAYRWFHILTEMEELTIERLATAEMIDANEISRVLPLALLAPNIIERSADNEGNLCITELRSLRALPTEWKQQALFLSSL